MLTEIISITSTGRPGALFSAPPEEEEWRKQTAAMIPTNPDPYPGSPPPKVIVFGKEMTNVTTFRAMIDPPDIDHVPTFESYERILRGAPAQQDHGSASWWASKS